MNLLVAPNAVTAAALLAATIVTSRAEGLTGSMPRQQSDTIVRMAGAPLHPGVGRLVEEVTIGRDNGPDHYIFGQVSELAVGPDSSIYVFDYSVPVLRKYDKRGTYMRDLGRGGQGPGEYGRASGLAIGKDGRVYLRDPSNDRINVFSAEGEVLESFTNAGSRLYTSDALVVDINGIIYTRARLGAVLGAGNGVIRMAPDGRVIDTLPEPAFDFQREEIQGVTGISFSVDRAAAGGRGGVDTTLARGGIALPFAPSPLWALSPLGYFVTGVPNSYSFELRIPRTGDAGTARLSGAANTITPLWSRGQPVVSIRRENVPRVPIASEERELRRKQTEESQLRMDPKWRWVGPEIPRVKPYYKRFDIGVDGGIAVSLHTAGERYVPEPPEPRPGQPPPAPPTPRYREPAEFDLFTPSGSYLGRVAVPNGTSVTVWWGNKAWGIVRDEYGVQTVKRWRIEW